MPKIKTITHRRKFENITAQRFNSLIVLRITNLNYSNSPLWECLCICGSLTTATKTQLQKGGKKSCGCLRHKYSHGLSRTRCSQVHDDMMRRCYNPEAKNYHNYGGRGINICQGWQIVTNLYNDLGEPAPKMSIERPNNNGGYWCGKCDECITNGWTRNGKWATRREQLQNKRVNVCLTAFGFTYVLEEWARLTGLCGNTIRYRLSKGWTVENTLSQPTRKGVIPNTIQRSD